ncbi:MAG: metallophosphatase [Candidatus Eremiobacteraeota bacterium]|nr:metallophosphatase [Candidatus Eremiobacteraeota bacterium]
MTKHNLTIYHTNDLHNRQHIFPFLSGVKNNGDVLILDAGDAIGGSSTLFKFSEPTLDKMNQVGYDAITMGNRELNYIRWVLKIRAEQANFPILSANLEDLTGRSADCYISHIIKEINGIKVGIFGLTPVQYQENSRWLNLLRFRFHDPLKTSGKMVEKLRSKVDLLILLSHLGIEDDKKIAQEVSGIDLIIGGHSHTVLKKPVHIKNTYIFQAGCYGKLYGKINIQVDPDKSLRISNLEYNLIEVNNNLNINKEIDNEK